MARKTKKVKQKTFRETVGLTNIFNNEKLNFIAGLILLGAAAYTTVAMVSFFMTGDVDQSILLERHPSEWLNANGEFKNTCGSFGAIIAWALMAVNFGIPAFLIPLFVIVLAFSMMNIARLSVWRWFFGLAITMIWASVAFAKYLTPLLPFLVFNPGGQHGAFIAEKVENMVGAPGLAVLLLLVAIIVLTFVTSSTIIWVRKFFRLGIDHRPKISWSVKVGGSSDDEDGVDGESDETTDYDDDADEEDFDDEDISVVLTDELKDDLDSVDDDAEGGGAIDLTDDLDELLNKTMPQPTTATNDSGAGDDSLLTVEKIVEEDQASGKTVGESVDLSTPINPREPFTRYKFPTLDLLKEYDSDKPQIDMEEIRENNARIIDVLNSFGVKIKEIKATVGPTITLYEVTPAEGVRISKIRNLEDDIALCLSALGVRIIAPIPGKGTVGIEVPNKNAQIVSMRSLLNSKKFQDTTMELPIAIGKTITNEVFMVDLAKLPHLLVAGATGQGKSVGLNAIITSLLYKKHPNELKIVLVDPKKVEFSPYAPIADHFMACIDENVDEPIITDVTKVVKTLNSLCALMDTRYDLLKVAGAKNIKEYNAKWVNHKLNPQHGHDYMPYIVVVIDEFGDLIMTAGKEVELPIARIAQLARAVGIHMIIATQRPTTNIITGNIKANFPGRMAFRVGAMIDSRTILDRPGANQLIGRGDLLFLNGGEPVRVQCAFVDTPEIEAINKHIFDQSGPREPMALPEPPSADGGGGASGESLGGDIDPYFEEAARAIVLTGQGSTSMTQR